MLSCNSNLRGGRWVRDRHPYPRLNSTHDDLQAIAVIAAATTFCCPPPCQWPCRPPAGRGCPLITTTALHSMTVARAGNPATPAAGQRRAPTMAFVVGGFPAGVAPAAAAAAARSTAAANCRCRRAFAGVAVAALPPSPPPDIRGVVAPPPSPRAMAAGPGRAESKTGGSGRMKRGGDGGGGGGVNSVAGGSSATTDATYIELDGVVQEPLLNAASRVQLVDNDDTVLLADIIGKIGSPNDDFLSSIGNSKSQSVTTLEPEKTERSFGTVLQELAAIQADGPRNVAILGTRHASYLHQQIIELLTYANVLVGNHVFTSGAAGTNYAVIKGALRAEKPDLLTVVLPQSMRRQPAESQTQVRLDT